MNVLPSHWVSFYPSPRNPLTAALARSFAVQCRLPRRFDALLERLDRR
jgi:hypothetical protein